MLELDNTEPSETEESQASFEQQVSEAVKGIKAGKEGVSELPEGLSPDVRFAANAEKRRRDTQSAWTKTQSELKLAQKENERLRGLVKPEVVLTVEQKEELVDLKGTDPDRWKEKLDAYEKEGRDKLDESLGAIDAQAELSRRADVLQSFTDSNEGFEINDQVLNEEIPSAMRQRLVDGKVKFEDFLVEARDYLAKTREKKEPDLNGSGGGASPEDQAIGKDIVESYKTTVF